MKNYVKRKKVCPGALLLPAPCLLDGVGRNRGLAGTLCRTPARPSRISPIHPVDLSRRLWHNVRRRPHGRFSGPRHRPLSVARAVGFSRFAVLRPRLAAGNCRFPFCGFFHRVYIYIPCKNGKTGNQARCRTDALLVLPFCGASPKISKSVNLAIDPVFPRMAGSPQNTVPSFCGTTRKTAKQLSHDSASCLSASPRYTSFIGPSPKGEPSARRHRM